MPKKKNKNIVWQKKLSQNTKIGLVMTASLLLAGLAVYLLGGSFAKPAAVTTTPGPTSAVKVTFYETYTCRPASGATVDVYKEPGTGIKTSGQPLASVISDTNGVINLNLPYGIYRLVVAKSSTTYANVLLDIGVDGPTETWNFALVPKGMGGYMPAPPACYFNIIWGEVGP